MKTNGFNAKINTTLFKRIQLLILSFFPIILFAQPQHGGICNSSMGMTNHFIFKTTHNSIKSLKGKSNYYYDPIQCSENGNPILNENQFNSSMKKPTNPMFKNPMIMKTTEIQFTFKNQETFIL